MKVRGKRILKCRGVGEVRMLMKLPREFFVGGGGISLMHPRTKS